MSKDTLDCIERELSTLDAEAMSFDHEQAEQCKEALLRIIETVGHLYAQIQVQPEHGPQADPSASYLSVTDMTGKVQFTGGGVVVEKK